MTQFIHRVDREKGYLGEVEIAVENKTQVNQVRADEMSEAKLRAKCKVHINKIKKDL